MCSMMYGWRSMRAIFINFFANRMKEGERTNETEKKKKKSTHLTGKSFLSATRWSSKTYHKYNKSKILFVEKSVKKNLI